ncbi:MAG: carboxypeptidase regulatory-like domain-containing protein, partial [Acidobacteria bacterium]|nr:carboxypeptidase regulatory-like domain-containing protein [Acidobacteriota bacterium]
MRGSVLSISGSPVAQAVLTVEDVSSSKAVKTETDARGEYELRGMAPGRYRLIVSAVGFLTQQRQGVALEAGETTREEFRVEPSPAGSPQKEDTTIGESQSAVATAVIDESELVGLPMNGRSYTQLVTLQAGVSDPAGGGRQGGQSSSITVSGGRGEWNAFLMDGADINDTGNQVPRSAAGGQLGADALLQVQVFATNYGAQYGRAAGGVVNAISRSGNNEFHGTLFEFLRNSEMDAHDFFDPPEKPPFKRNQFGAMVTGPLIREKTFFMASFEVLLNRLAQNVVSFVPDQEARQGRLLLPGREPILANPKALPYLALYPLPQVPLLDRNGNPTGTAENRTSARLPTSDYFFVARVDQRLGDRDALFGRYSFDDADQMSVGSTAELPWRTKSRQQYLTLAETHIFSTALLNTFRASYTRPTSTFDSAHTREIPRSLFFVPSAPRYGQLHVA